MFEMGLDAMLVMDDEGRCVEANAAAVALLGATRPELLDLSSSDVFPREPHDAVAFDWSAFLGTGHLETDGILRRRDGSERFVELRATAHVVPGFHLVVLRDVTERQRSADRCADAKRAEAQLAVTERMVSVGTLAAGVAHEINNPLAAVIANLDFVAVGLENAEEPGGIASTAWQENVLDPLADARESAEQLRNIVRDLRVFSRPDEERRGPVELRRLIDSSLRMAWNEIRHRARLVKCYGDVPRVHGNEARLGQVFLNLVVNAAQAIREGDALNHEIRVTTRRGDPGQVIIEVRDTGAGIPREIQPRLFEPFFTTKPVGVGTGLGLSICKRIVMEHGGAISVDSAPGRGTTFRVTLPEATSAEVAVVAGPEPVRSVHRGHVLVVDDEPVITRAVERALVRDYQVTSCTSAEAALVLLRGGAMFDAIICDLMMPQVTGMDFHDILAATMPLHLPSLVFLSGGAFTLAARDFLDRTPIPRLEKPFAANELRDALAALLAKRRP